MTARDNNAAQFQATSRGCRRRAAEGKPAFSHIYRPADLYLNGKCTDANGYTIERNNLVPLSACRCVDGHIIRGRAAGRRS
jgi:hypothetical protein